MALKKNKFDQIIDRLRELISKDDRYAELSSYFNEIKRDPDSNPFGSSELLAEISDRIIAINDPGSFKIALLQAAEIFRTVVPLGKQTPDYEHRCAVFIWLFERDGVFENSLFTPGMYDIFADKDIYVQTMDSIKRIHKADECIDFITSFAMSSKQYFTDEITFSAAVIDAAEKLSCAPERQDTTDDLVAAAQRSVGIYDLSEDDISTAEKNVREIRELVYAAEKKIEALEKLTKSFTRYISGCEESIKALSAEEERSIRSAAGTAALDIKDAYEKMLSSEQKKLDLDKDKLMRDLVEQSDEKIRELRMISESIKENAAADLYRINTEANRAVERASAMLGSDEMKNLISTLDKNEGLVRRIVRVEEMSRKFEEKEEQEQRTERVERPERTAGIASVRKPSANVPSPVIKDSGVHPDTKAEMYSLPPDMTVNRFFDEGVPFEKRMALLMKLKEDNIKARGMLYHERFNDILTAVIENANPYLIGPSGCGKTYIVGQIAGMLGLEYLDIGYINEEYDIIGFQTASGGYSYPSFYRAYKYGGIVFCDEFDNSNSRAAVKLNSFMSDGKGASYCFPNGERVMRHPNFRIIAAGNTSGAGADRNYNTREKIEESVQQRFTSMYVTYDNRLEEKILENYPDWFDFVREFRNATDQWSRTNDCPAPGIFTTRDAAGIKRYLDHGSFDTRAILDYEFIETKDTEYLLYLVKAMERPFITARNGKLIYRQFCERVDEIAKNGGIR
ncbi:MAG: AAA family ATPase [Oscillospiraceae bacterium]|nr:AAA family ATPase [Oscillospiraceae bacterium]